MKNKIVDIFDHLLGKKGFDYSEIDEEVIIGTNMCCRYGFSKELLARDVRADISLEEKRVDAPFGVDYFLWLPTVDGQAPSPDKLTLGVRMLEFLSEKGVKVYIHCMNGHGRAPTLYIAYLMKKGMSLDASLALVKAQRPGAHLTKAQTDALNAFSRARDQGWDQ